MTIDRTPSSVKPAATVLFQWYSILRYLGELKHQDSISFCLNTAKEKFIDDKEANALLNRKRWGFGVRVLLEKNFNKG